MGLWAERNQSHESAGGSLSFFFLFLLFSIAVQVCSWTVDIYPTHIAIVIIVRVILLNYCSIYWSYNTVYDKEHEYVNLAINFP